MALALLIGNSDGIGLELTKLLLEEGWEVIGVSRSASQLIAPTYTHHILDVCEPDYLSRLTTIVDTAKGLTTCVYCAGIGDLLEIETMTGESKVFKTNLLGAVATAEVIIPRMLHAGHGHFIGLSSQADGMANAQAPSYAASKAGLTCYLEGLALACKPRHVQVTVLRLGFVDTKMAKGPVRPFMITTKTAAHRIRRCMVKRPISDTFPKRLALLLLPLRAMLAIRKLFA